jgi:hypothetical protein
MHCRRSPARAMRKRPISQRALFAVNLTECRLVGAAGIKMQINKPCCSIICLSHLFSPV